MSDGPAIGEALPRRHLDAGGVRFSYCATGGGTGDDTGPPLVLLHSTPSSSAQYQGAFPYLEDRVRAIAMYVFDCCVHVNVIARADMMHVIQ